MGLFVCSTCGAVENTALGLYWAQPDHPECSECGKGEWHGRFPKEKLSDCPSLKRETLTSFYLVSTNEPVTQ
jgi:hypothetical protein